MKYLYLSLVMFLSFTFAGNAQENNEKIHFANHAAIPEIMKEFVDGAKYYNVDYKEKLNSIDAIRLVPGESNFLGRVQGNTIEVNQFLTHYPNLLRVVVLRQLGKFYGLEAEKSSKLVHFPGNGNSFLNCSQKKIL